MQNNCIIIAGEKSGEEHCLSFFSELKAQCPNTHFWGVGGDDMIASGFEALYHLNEFGGWGYSGVVKKIPFYKSVMDKILAEADQRNTKAAILIDFQTFNLKIAAKLKKKGVKILYYVAPQAWAWKAYRAEKIKAIVEKLYTILPFEEAWFKARGINQVVAVNHPLIRRFQKELDLQEDLNISDIEKKFENNRQCFNLLLLPGSRSFEVNNLFPTFIETVKILKSKYNVNVGLVASSSVKHAIFDSNKFYIDRVFSDKELSQALNWASFCFAASGTVTLACGLFRVPTIVCYSTSLLNEFIFYTFVNYRGFISITNLIHEKELFPELVQERVSSYNIMSIMKVWLNNKTRYCHLVNQLQSTKKFWKNDNLEIIQSMKSVIASSEAT